LEPERRGSCSPLKDNREKIEVRFGDEKLEFEKGPDSRYLRLVEENRGFQGLPDSWKIEVVRAEEDRIIIECADGATTFWFTEELGPPLDATKDKLREAANDVPPVSCGRGVSSVAPMQSR
jgi:hypothetical protein